MTHHRRRGFTLVEILVAMALTIFILAILTQAFVVGADTFRSLKAVGDLNTSLRTASTALRSDLSAAHFEGMRRLSDSKFWSGVNNGPPKFGYLYVYQGPPTAFNVEATDPDGIVIRRCNTHILALTVRAAGDRQKDWFAATVPAGSPLLSLGVPDTRYTSAVSNVFTSQWAEVIYFMVPITDITADGTPLFTLYRQQHLAVSDNDQINWGANKQPLTQLQAYRNKICARGNPNPNGINNQYLYFNSPADLTIPERRCAGTFITTGANAGTVVAAPLTDATGALTGEDILLTDVLSFDIKAHYAYTWVNPDPVANPNGSTTTVTTTEFSDLLAPYYFDTWSRRVDDVYDYSATPIPVASITTTNPPTTNASTPYRLLALQITMRVWDAKTKITRQISIVQEL
jgi:prepilin-type N-terminal cleavage/methylation domain-containing protein